MTKTLNDKLNDIHESIQKLDDRISDVETSITPPSPTDPARTIRTAKGAISWRRLFRWKYFTRFGAVCLAVSAIFSTVQWYDLRKNFEFEHRAWVQVRLKPQMGPTPKIIQEISNVGKSPMLGSVIRSWVQVVKNEEYPNLDETGIYDEGHYPILLPTEGYPYEIYRFKSNKSVFPFTQPEIDSLNAGTSYVVVFGFVAYKDNFGEHWQKFCYWSLAWAREPNELNIYRSAGSCLNFNATGDGHFTDKDWKTK